MEQDFATASEASSQASPKCPICQQKFKGTDRVTILNCKQRHMGHSQCINSSILRRMECPLCSELQQKQL